MNVLVVGEDRCLAHAVVVGTDRQFPADDAGRSRSIQDKTGAHLAVIAVLVSVADPHNPVVLLEHTGHRAGLADVHSLFNGAVQEDLVKDGALHVVAERRG